VIFLPRFHNRGDIAFPLVNLYRGALKFEAVFHAGGKLPDASPLKIRQRLTPNASFYGGANGSNILGAQFALNVYPAQVIRPGEEPERAGEQYQNGAN
jgi:hypothetical protein